MRGIFLVLLLILSACAVLRQNRETQSLPNEEQIITIDQPTEKAKTPLARPTRIAITSVQAPTNTPFTSPISPTITPVLIAVTPSDTASYQSELSSIAISTCLATPKSESGYNWNAAGNLGAGLWAGGVVYFHPEGPGVIERDGSLSMKFFWRRHNVAGQLVIEGRRLDASAPPLQADVPEGYGDTGFQASGLTFSTEGCWEVTGSAGEASLTFVVLVVKIPLEPLLPDWIPEDMIDEGPDLFDFPQSFRRVYGFTGGGEGELIVETTQGLRDDTSYPEASKQQATVKGQTGICVQGAWDESGQWLADADAGALEWAAGGFSYRISHSGLGLTCDDLLRVAGDPGG